VNGVSLDLDQSSLGRAAVHLQHMIDLTRRWVFVVWYTWVATLVCAVAYLIFR
jgi:hypothetical protein